MTAANVRADPPGGNGAAKDARPARPPLTLDLDVDVCVIGGGVAGLTAARELASRGRSVAVLEAGRIPWSVTDRSEGIVAPGFSVQIERIVERVGLQHAKELWALASDGLDHLRRTARESMPGVHTVSAHLAVARSRAERLRLRANTLRDEFGADVEFWPAARLRSALPTSPYFQALHFPNAFHLNSLAYVHGLAAAAEQAGARIFEDTPAHHIDAEGVRKRVDTKSARVRASQIVLTDGAQAGRLFPRVSDTVLSFDAFAAVTAPLGEGLRSAMAFQGSVCEVDGDAAFHTLDGERLLWSARTTTRAGDPQRMSARLRGDIARTFPQLGPVEIAHAWSARAGYAVHRMPQLGELKSGLWLANAFGRQGLGTSTTAGLLIAGAIAEGDDRWRLFSSYGLSWNGGAAARALVEAAPNAADAHSYQRLPGALSSGSEAGARTPGSHRSAAVRSARRGPRRLAAAAAGARACDGGGGGGAAGCDADAEARPREAGAQSRAEGRKPEDGEGRAHARRRDSRAQDIEAAHETQSHNAGHSRADAARGGGGYAGRRLDLSLSGSRAAS
jgi:gamma-glutamylputrescine oxidase